MTHAEFCTKFGLTPGVMHKPVPGLGILAPYSTGRRGTVTICSSHEQYMHLIFVESECCLVASGNDIRHLVTVKDEIRQGILEYLNHILETLGSPVRYLYNKDHKTLLLYNTKTNTWSFKLVYTYKTPGYNSIAEFIRVDATSWQQNSQGRRSNSLEGKFDPDLTLEERKLSDVVKLIVENI